MFQETTRSPRGLIQGKAVFVGIVVCTSGRATAGGGGGGLKCNKGSSGGPLTRSGGEPEGPGGSADATNCDATNRDAANCDATNRDAASLCFGLLIGAAAAADDAGELVEKSREDEGLDEG
jgi:hypothetical protein